MRSTTFTFLSWNLHYGAIQDSTGRPDDRWSRAADLVRYHDPDVVLFQECHGWMDQAYEQVARAEWDLGMRIHVASSPVGGSTAVGHRFDIPWMKMEERYIPQTANGF